MSTASLPSVMTVDEFFDWPTPDGSHRWELVDGIAVAMAPASDRHGSIQAEASRLVGNHLADHRPDCRVVIEPVTSPDNHNVRIPDFTVTCGPIDPAARFSAPVLIVEVLSPSNWKKTWGQCTALHRDRKPHRDTGAAPEPDHGRGDAARR